MKNITKKDLLEFINKYGKGKKKQITITKKIATSMNLKDLLCFVALQTMEFGRSLESSIENAMCWGENGKEDIIKTFFSKDYEKVALLDC